MTLHDFLCLLLGGAATGLVCAAIYAGAVVVAERVWGKDQ